MFLLAFLLLTKHFLFDFLFQTPFQYENKGIYGHIGGILHSALQALGTFLVFVIVSAVYKSHSLFDLAGVFAVLDFVVHYHIDWAKVNIGKALNLSPKNREFWWFLGFDQYLHYLTYLLMFYIFSFFI